MKLEKNPYIWYRVNPDLFVGRDVVLESTRRNLLAGRSIALIGGRKIGKTTFLRKLISVLDAQLVSGDSVLPAYVDSLAVPSPFTQVGLYCAVILEIDRALRSLNLDVSLSELCSNGSGSLEHVGFDSFKQGLKRLLEHLSARGQWQIILLFDEVGPIATSEWGGGFFANWRALISNTPEVSPFLSVLFSGAKEMSSLSEDIGSPLANVLTSRFLGPLNWAATRALAQQPIENGLSQDVAREIFVVTGGHPFLAQYILHHICEHDLAEAYARLEEGVDKFLQDEAGQFVTWWRHHFSRDERTAYIYLSETEKRISRPEINAVTGGETGGTALATLCNFGVVRSDVLQRYRTNGELFRKWVSQFSSSEKAAALYDSNIYSTLSMLDPEIARKYATAWSIYGSEFENYSGAVSEVRDVVTLTLHLLAPDSQVRSQSWYRPEKDNNGQDLKTPTRRQRVEYIIKNKSDHSRNLPEHLALLETLAEQVGKGLTGTYSYASAKTHRTATRNQAWRCLKQLDSVLAQIL